MNIGKSQFSLARGEATPKLLIAIVVGLCVVLLCVSTILAFVFGKNHKAEKSVNDGRAALLVAQAAQNTKEAEAKLLQEQLNQLTQSMTNSIVELKAAKEKIQSLETAEQERQQKIVATKQPALIEIQRPLPTRAKIQVYEILADWGFKKCRTQIGEVGIRNLPREIGKYLDELKRMKAEYAQMAKRFEEQDREARRANAVALTSASGNSVYVDAAMAERRRANLMVEDARDAQIALEKYKANLTSWENATEENTTVFAVQTSQIYGGVVVYDFAGIAR